MTHCIVFSWDLKSHLTATFVLTAQLHTQITSSMWENQRFLIQCGFCGNYAFHNIIYQILCNFNGKTRVKRFTLSSRQGLVFITIPVRVLHCNLETYDFGLLRANFWLIFLPVCNAVLQRLSAVTALLKAPLKICRENSVQTPNLTLKVLFKINVCHGHYPPRLRDSSLLVIHGLCS